MEGRADPDFTSYRIAVACKSGSKTVATHRSNASQSHSQPHNSHGIDAILKINKYQGCNHGKWKKPFSPTRFIYYTQAAVLKMLGYVRFSQHCHSPITLYVTHLNSFDVSLHVQSKFFEPVAFVIHFVQFLFAQPSRTTLLRQPYSSYLASRQLFASWQIFSNATSTPPTTVPKTQLVLHNCFLLKRGTMQNAYKSVHHFQAKLPLPVPKLPTLSDAF